MRLKRVACATSDRDSQLSNGWCCGEGILDDSMNKTRRAAVPQDGVFGDVPKNEIGLVRLVKSSRGEVGCSLPWNLCKLLDWILCLFHLVKATRVCHRMTRLVLTEEAETQSSSNRQCGGDRFAYTVGKLIMALPLHGGRRGEVMTLHTESPRGNPKAASPSMLGSYDCLLVLGCFSRRG